MKKLLLLLPIILLQGCLWQSVGSETLYYANKFCNEKGMKVNRIDEFWNGKKDLICSPNGLYSNIHVEWDFHEYIKEQKRMLTNKVLLEGKQGE